MAWVDRARRLQLIAQAGLTYAADPFDRERFAEVQRIAAEMLAEGMAQPVAAVLPLLQAEKGYPTPKVDVRSAVFRDGRILLVRERSDGNWSLPGGWADLGESAATVAVREIKEESGFDARVTKLLAVLDKARHGHPPSLWHVYQVAFRAELTGSGEPAPRVGHEIDATGWFARDAIPPLSLPRTTPSQVARAFEHLDRPDLPADFD